MICQIIGLTSITLLSDKNSFKYFLISNQLVESGVPRLTIKTPVFPKLTDGCSVFFSINKIKKFLLIKPSNYEKGIFKPIIMKIGSQRRGKKGLMDMATDIEMIGRRLSLTLHDKIFNELRPAMQSYIINTTFQKRFTMKIQETSLVFVKYE